MRIAFIKHPDQAWLIVGALMIYLTAFFVTSMLGFIYAAPLLFLIPIFGYYLIQSIIHPILLIVPMLGATYLGDIVSIFPVGAVPFTLFQILLISSIAVYIIHFLLSQKDSIRILGIELELLLGFTLISLSIIYSPNQINALFNLSRMVLLVIMVYLIVNTFRYRIHFITAFSLLVFISLILGILSIYSSLLDPLTAVKNLRAGGMQIIGRGAITIRDPNVFASFFFLPIAISTSVSFSKLSYYWRIPALGITLILLLSLASTYSRSSWLSATFLLLLLIIYYRQYKMMGMILAGILLLILAVPELRNISIGLINRVFDIFSGMSDDSSRIRVLLGIAGIRIFFDSYFMGVGFRGFPDKFTNYFTSQESIGVVEPHNIIYEILAELGLIGLGLFLVMTIIIFRQASQNVKNSITESDKIIATSLISTLVAFIIFFQLYGGALVNSNLWSLIGLVIAQGYYLKIRSTPT